VEGSTLTRDSICRAHPVTFKSRHF